MTLFLTHNQTHFLNSLMEYGQKYNPWIERVYLENLLMKFLKRLASFYSILLLYNGEKKAYTKPPDKKKKVSLIFLKPT